jgi:uncharacterized protein (DUF736 family)
MPSQYKERIMISIGDFIKKGQEFHGVIETLSLLHEVWLIPRDPARPDEPDYSLHFAERPGRIGKGWNKRAEDGSKYIHVHVSDPGLPAPIDCRLVKRERRYDLLWDEQRAAPECSVRAIMLDALKDAEIEIEQMLEDLCEKPEEDVSALRTLATVKAAIAAAEPE